MVAAPAEDTLALIASHPEHSLDCFRLIRPGQTYHQGADNTVLCPSCFGGLLIGEDFETFPAANDLAVDVGGGLLRVRREGASIVVRSQEVRHLVDALVEGAVNLDSYGICLLGDFRAGHDDPTPGQLDAARWLVGELGVSEVVPHKWVVKTSCPGRWGKWGKTIEEGINANT